jgi:hypothetical protein
MLKPVGNAEQEVTTEPCSMFLRARSTQRERIFGILKRRFSLMVASPEYSEDKQAKFIPALCVLHNFISIHDHDSTDTGQQLSPRADSSD